MLTNHLLVHYGGLRHRDAWLVTMVWTGVYNYFLLKANWRAKPTDRDREDAPLSSHRSPLDDDKAGLLP
jgi:hypothetical protein